MGADRIEKIKLEYSKLTNITLDGAPKGCEWNTLVKRHKEELILDRASGTLETVREMGSGCRMSWRIEAPIQVRELMDKYYPEYLFAHVRGVDPQADYGSEVERGYRLTIECLSSPTRVIEGRFDRDGLPVDYPDFVEDLFSLMDSMDPSEMFDPAIFRWAPRKQGELIFCHVAFERPDNKEVFMTSDDTLRRGDLVVIETKEGGEAIGVIDSLSYYSPDDCPFDMKNMRNVLRRTTSEDLELMYLGSPEDDSEPIPELTAEEWAQLHSDDRDEGILAHELAGAWNETDWLVDMAEIDVGLRQRLEEWIRLEGELIDRVLDILMVDDSRIEDSDKGLMEALRPFMERNGYTDVGFLWLPMNKGE